METAAKEKYFKWLIAALALEKVPAYRRKPLISSSCRHFHKGKEIEIGEILECWPSVKWYSSLGEKLPLLAPSGGAQPT